MKTIAKLLFVLTLIMTLSQACKKCTSCQYTYKSSTSQQDTTESFGEACGTPDDIDNYEKNCDQTAKQYGANCACTTS